MALHQSLPERVQFALSWLDLDPSHRVLEFGCGNGVAAHAIAARLTTGSIVAIDRSTTAAARARSAGDDVEVRQVELADVTTNVPFDRVLGINVNVFWTGEAGAECAALNRVLAPDGMVLIVYETPGAARPEISDRVASNLARHGFAATVARGDTPSLVAIRAIRADRSTGR